jgi:hypothetical protein
MSESLLETNPPNEAPDNRPADDPNQTEQPPVDALTPSVIEIGSEYYKQCIESNLQMYGSKSSRENMQMSPPMEPAEAIPQQSIQEETLSNKISKRSSELPTLTNEDKTAVEPEIISEEPQPQEPTTETPGAKEEVRLSRQSSKTHQDSVNNPHQSKESLAYNQKTSHNDLENIADSHPEDDHSEEIKDKVAPLTDRSRDSRPHSIKARSSKKQLDEPIRVSFADPQNLITLADDSKPLLKKFSEHYETAPNDNPALIKRESIKPILVKEDSYLREKRMSCNKYTSLLVIASKNVSQIVKGMAKAFSKPKTVVMDDENEGHLAPVDLNNFSRSALDDYHAESSAHKHRDSLKLSRCASMNKSVKKYQEATNEIDMLVHDTNNFDGEDDEGINSEADSQISKFKSIGKITFKKSSIQKTKSGEYAIRPAVSFVLTSEPTHKKSPMSYQDIGLRNKPPLSPTRFPVKKTSQFNQNSSLHQIEEAFFNRQKVSQAPEQPKPSESNTSSQPLDLRIKEVKIEDSDDEQRGRQPSESRQAHSRDLAPKLRESNHEAMNSAKKTENDFKELLRAKQATDLILKINLEKQARLAQMERRQQQQLLKFQKQVLESQKLVHDAHQADLRNSKVEKILENIKQIHQRGENRRKANSKSNHVIKRIQDTMANFYQKPCTIELAEEQRRAIILEKIKSEHRPIDPSEIDEHQKLYDECALLMRAELASKRRVLPERMRQSEDKVRAKNTIRRIIDRETEIERQNREVGQMIRLKNQLLESTGVDLRRSQYKPGRVAQTPQGHSQSNVIDGMVEDRSIEYKTVSKAIPVHNYSARIRQAIASSLQIPPERKQALIEANTDNRLPTLPEPSNPSSFGKQSFYFSGDVYEANGMRYSFDPPQFSRSNDIKPNLTNSQKLTDSHFKENKNNPDKNSSHLQNQHIPRTRHIAAPMENKTALPKIVQGVSNGTRPDPLNPWKSIK